MIMIKKLLKFFDKTEDKVREILSRYVILYAFIGGVAIVLFWRGVWKIADGLFFMTGVMSVILFVSFFIGDRIILSGLKKEKKLAEKTEEEIKSELERSIRIIDKLEKIEKDLEEVKNKIK